MNRTSHYLKAGTKSDIIYAQDEVEYLQRLQPFFQGILFYQGDRTILPEEIFEKYILLKN